MSALRHQVLRTYKELLYLGKEYPTGYNYFRTRCHRAFSKNAGLMKEDDIRNALARAEFVKREIEALYYLRKYRELRKRYA